jgi:hypothetical protein
MLRSPARRLAVVAGVGLAALGYYALAVQTPPGPRSLQAFSADRLALLETRMWQAYYTHDRLALFRLLIAAMREQYRYPYTKAARAAFHFARAASDFSQRRSGYEDVLPDLVEGYRIARDWTGGGFDPASVARAELAWWVARRTPDAGDPAHVGALIAEEYSLLYEVPRSCVEESARIRAEAAHLRDQGGAAADWKRIEAMLIQSFMSLSAALRIGCRA